MLRIVLRQTLAMPMSAALLVALLMAPYQHVHLAAESAEAGHEHHDHDGGDSAIVHIHFYAVSLPDAQPGASQVGDSDNDHVALSLDTFKVIAHAALLP